jgi:hypothetical protein
MPSKIIKSSVAKLPITLMTSTNQELEEGEIFNRNDFKTPGQRIKIGIVQIIEVQQDTYDENTKIWSKLMRPRVTFNPKNGKRTSKMEPVKGYLVIMYEKDDPECTVRTLKLNSKAGVKYMEKYLETRKGPITKFIPDEELVLEKVDNGFKYASVLPVGA